MRRKLIILSSALGLAMALPATADVSSVRKIGLKNNNIETAKILYVGDITAKGSTELISSIDEINANYPNLKKLYLYINSYGGSMENGYMAYEAIKSAPVPITTVNIAMVASAASLLYCAGAERYATPSAHFILHPAAASNIQKDYLKPNEIARLQQDVKNSNAFFRYVYQQCTRYSADEIDNMLSREDGRQYIDTPTALDKRLATGQAAGMVNADVSYYILSKDN
ncbi:peptidase S14 [Affinibrenneria salicis]|uniref:ATP-dependent Clp protease proteolytic subunit n=1 Tax=Affinibrenneria salicis TaxID=2590031 RepID=A0A5J5G4I4_9GAMM|nr:ATP-dependent Clp protease proteolytic subunit [Affinibrenneria salicis]KAA9001971.1 peptidase S14 [Affinibrenneria salicis]